MAIFADLSLAELKALRKSLGEAILSGTLRVRFADRDVTYRSLDEMRTALTLADDAIAAQEGTATKRKTLINTQKGF